MSYSTLEEAKREWADNQKYIVFEESLKDFHLRIYHDVRVGFTIQRFFEINGKWEVSVDLSNVSVRQIIKRLVYLLGGRKE